MILQFVGVEISQKNFQRRVRHSSFEHVGMQESVPTVGRFRRKLWREFGNEGACRTNGVYHFIFGNRRMNIDSGEFHQRHVG